MVSAVDSFVTFLSTSLGSPMVLPVKFLRQDARDPNTEQMLVNALNVRALDTGRVGSVESVMVSLDILASNERQGWRWAEAVQQVLAPLMIQEYDYETSPATPLPTTRCISWMAEDVVFQLVGSNQHYVQLNLTLDISYAWRA